VRPFLNKWTSTKRKSDRDWTQLCPVETRPTRVRPKGVGQPLVRVIPQNCMFLETFSMIDEHSTRGIRDAVVRM
jgi:hypothetical protein